VGVNDYAAGQGAAISLDEDITFTDSVFLNNAASSLNINAQDSGWGGAFVLREPAVLMLNERGTPMTIYQAKSMPPPAQKS